MGVEASVLYHLQPEMAADILPEDRHRLRGRASGPELQIGDPGGDGGKHRQLALLGRTVRGSPGRILADLQQQVQPRGIVIENVLLRDLQLPDTLKNAIEAKQQAGAGGAADGVRPAEEREQEAERKRVEASGIKDFQNIVTQGISDKLLEWKGIEATIELSKSQNAKVVVVGNPRNGLPLLFSAEK